MGKLNLRNAFYAQAIADAVGRPFEFHNPTTKEVRDYLSKDAALEISDDTQMALFGLEALTRTGKDKGIVTFRKQVKEAYLRWYVTQTKDPIAVYEGLWSYPEMWRVEAPGNTCLTSLKMHSQRRSAINKSNGCGTVMRLLPFASHYVLSGDWIKALGYAKASAVVTHRGNEIETSTFLFMDFARRAWQYRGNDPIEFYHVKKIEQLGSGWTAMECLNMAVWAYQRATTYEDMLVRAICHPGDSDSVAAVAGALWGLSGRPVPQSLIDRLEVKKVIDDTITLYEEEYGYQTQAV